MAKKIDVPAHIRDKLQSEFERIGADLNELRKMTKSLQLGKPLSLNLSLDTQLQIANFLKDQFTPGPWGKHSTVSVPLGGGFSLKIWKKGAMINFTAVNF